ncbi:MULTISPECIES: DUF1876 domain-containing protein [unclassified Streptomyces]|uniref:DUF1876 domain-containing protein n=1 Tax=unclassified Streptomyces TaxID=2593676 RepID=UPI00224F79F7|nr:MULTISPECIES: DUF1876 domain-containing protein [unclassified Streptomyces]WSP53475.1 DUF1876 domain-containing protein [Streptomyces sp. NBC_01241]WSU25856.1 DUF1876 domain-containing protein [Streptomyces sp. NBC_01108]WTA34167.1 DUF1876 domain-containing protein [Streptomyces sp. NBC_00846]MCX4784854.1 DUF1876 domain-containing protein [Streptomyces sp. NBC_01221]MCX4799193.1 DUF1876 domain-containing protein [Streptomyces sp. NBC_01242]
MTRRLEWKVRVGLSEEDGTTRAEAVLDTGSEKLVGHGVARCNPQDVDVPAIGDELAASRAMKDIAAQLMKAADQELESVGAGPATGPVTPPYAWSDTTA